MKKKIKRKLPTEGQIKRIAFVEALLEDTKREFHDIFGYTSPKMAAPGYCAELARKIVLGK